MIYNAQWGPHNESLFCVGSGTVYDACTPMITGQVTIGTTRGCDLYNLTREII